MSTISNQEPCSRLSQGVIAKNYTGHQEDRITKYILKLPKLHSRIAKYIFKPKIKPPSNEILESQHLSLITQFTLELFDLFVS